MEHTAPRPRPWLIVVPTVANVYEQDPTLQKLMNMYRETVNGFKQNNHYTVCYSSPSWPETFGGIWHLFRQSENLDRLGKQIYLDLCSNQRFISAIYIIATESGAYLIMQVLQFLREYGNTLHHDWEKLHKRWLEFIFSGQLTPDQVLPENELLGLVRSVNLIHPSLPPPSGLARLTWSLIAPGPYRYRNVPLPNNTATFHCLVIWIKEIDEVTRYRVSIPDNAKVEWIEGDDTESLKRLIHKHILKAEMETRLPKNSSLISVENPNPSPDVECVKEESK